MWEIVAYVFLAIGALLSIAGGIWTLVEAFRTGALWGIGCILCGLVYLIWLAKNWQEGWPPLVLSISGWVPSVVGFAILTAETMTK